MRHIGPVGTVLAVAAVVIGMLGGTAVVAHERGDSPIPSGQQLQQPAAAKKPELRLTTTATTVEPGTRVGLRVRTSTKHPRVVRIQHWDSRRKAWRQVAKRVVRATATVQVRPTAGTTRYRAVSPRVRHGAGRATHVHQAGRSAQVSVRVRARSTGHRPASLTGEEKALLAAVATARTTYAREAVVAADDDGADACLTDYARAHSTWMAQQGRALDPGSPEHRAARRSLPAAACPGNTVWSVTRAVGGASASTAVTTAIDAWLSSPYGETTRLLTACHDAPVFEFGVATVSSGGTRWLTVLVASDTPVTTSAGVC